MALTIAKRPSSQVSSKLCWEETVIIWNVGGWAEEDGDDFNFLKLNAMCDVDIATSAWRTKNIPLARLQFYFGEYRQPRINEYDGARLCNVGVDNLWLSLLVKELSCKEDTILQYDISVTSVDDKLDVIPDGSSVEKRRFKLQPNAAGTKELLLKNDFIKLQRQVYGYNDPPSVCPRSENLRLKISVTPMFVCNAMEKKGLMKPEEETSLTSALRDMFAASENFADLKLETKDGMTLSAHKFILSARSPVLRELIEKKVKEDGYKGTIKLPDVNAKPMVVIIHWMYTGDLHEKAGYCMEEVVDVAIAFRLNGLIKILDKEVITICTTDNMFQLYRVAQKNGMLTAAEDVSKFIKAHI